MSEISKASHYRSFYDMARLIEDPIERCAFYDALDAYRFDGIEPDLKNYPFARMAFVAAKANVDADLKRKKGGAPEGNQNAKKQPKNNLKQPHCFEKTNNVNANDNDNVNATANANNNSTQKRVELSDSAAEAEKVSVNDFEKAVKTELNLNVYSFSDDLAPIVIENCKKEDVDIKDFVKFCKKQTTEKKPVNFSGLFYKIAKDKTTIQNYKNEHKPRAPDSTECPVCKKRVFGKYVFCPTCHFNFDDIHNQARIKEWSDEYYDDG